MKGLEPGRVCIKTKGRQAGKLAIVIGNLENNLVTIAGPQIKKRKCNINHLLPTNKKVSVTASTTQEELKKLLA